MSAVFSLSFHSMTLASSSETMSAVRSKPMYSRSASCVTKNAEDALRRRA